ncbi:MAG: hypothetical protein ACC608_10855 [Anaerofustis sp.]
MELKNSYIFLSKEPASQQSEQKLSDMMMKFFPTLILQNEANLSVYKGFLNDAHITVSIRQSPIGDYCDVSALHHYQNESVKCLEEINRTIMSEKNEFRQKYIPVISFDSVSEYYCNRIHPKLNELDRRLRQLMFHIYTSHFGADYIQSDSFDELLQKMRLNADPEQNAAEKHSIETIRYAIKTLRKFNTKTSHCNFFYEKKFIQCSDLIGEMIQTVDKAIDWIDLNSEKEHTENYYDTLKSYTDHVQNLTQEIQAIGNDLFEIDQIS